ncbi:hypothetical protein LguiB_011844 [Lonicera macranthoides]
MDRSRFVIESSEAKSMAKNSDLNLLQLLPSLVKSAQTLARSPISNFPVGAVGLGSTGRIFTGVNLEFPGLPLHHSVHAEQFLITNLAVHGEPRLRYLAVSAAPCGHCRQFLQELRCASDVQFLITDGGSENLDFKPLFEILPNPFGPRDLLDEQTPLLLEKKSNGLSLSTIDANQSPFILEKRNKSLSLSNDSKHNIRLSLSNDSKHQLDQQISPSLLERLNNGLSLSNQLDEQCNGTVYELLAKNEFELKNLALKAANNSHAPYSGSPSGVALMDCDGGICSGSYMESAAYNPSLGPVQAALVAYVAGGGGGYERILAAVLVEKGGAVVRQEDTARLLLKVISPKCEFRVFHCDAWSSNGCK